MDNRIEKIKLFRKFLLTQIEELSTEQLNAIPEGYNNNIIWNLGHLICAQQTICYFRSGLPVVVEDKYYTPFKTTTKPDGFIDSHEIAIIKDLFISTIDQLQTDFEQNIFGKYTPSENVLRVYGLELKNIGDALEFSLYHEGIHSGYITSLKRLVS